ncbi:MAG: hypothetical protein LBT33_10775 [Spirochaetia bacterium]|jgi:hypothetical protein|nr:hypothetical protein [Spirochaetia bacterium]
MALKEVDRIISEVHGLNEKERIIFFKKIEKLYANPGKTTEEDDPIQAVFGMWNDYDIDKKMLSAKAWRKN